MKSNRMGKYSRYFWTALKNPRLGMYEIHNFVTRTYAKAKFKKHGLIPYIAGLSPDVYEPQFGDLWHLYSLIRKRRPELALEFGSGYSTIIMAQAIHENGRGKLISIESEEKWKRSTESAIPEHLTDIVTIQVMEPVAEIYRAIYKRGPNRAKDLWYKPRDQRFNYCGFLVHRYPELAKMRPNFFYLDGPDPDSVKGYMDSKGNMLPPVAADPIYWEDGLPEDFCMVIDTRLPNMDFLVDNLKRKYRLHWERANKRSTFYLINS